MAQSPEAPPRVQKAFKPNRKAVRFGLVCLVLGLPLIVFLIPDAMSWVLSALGSDYFTQMKQRASVCRLYRALHIPGYEKLYSRELVAGAEDTLLAEWRHGRYQSASRHAATSASYIALCQPKSNSEAVILYQWSQIDIDAGRFDDARKVLEHYVNRFGPPEAPLGNPHIYAYALANLGNFLALKGDSKQALVRKLQAAQLWERDPSLNALPLAQVNEEAAVLCQDVLHDAKSAEDLRRSAEYYRHLSAAAPIPTDSTNTMTSLQHTEELKPAPQ